MFEIGSLIDGKYRIQGIIGQGGMSVVYLAINERSNKQWAIKEVRKDGVMNFESVKQGLIAETSILKKLNHTNLPSIADIIDTEDSFIVIMDYIPGTSLNEILTECGAQPEEKVVEWAKQLCDVLEYLHSRVPPIIYRDMKPANIMLKPDGNITLIDFGAAREFKAEDPKETVLLSDTICLGTVGYAAPKQFGGMGQSDARTDIYCLGMTLFQLVTGEFPTYEVRSIREINPALSKDLERVITKCTQTDPNSRYQTAAELREALEHCNKAGGIADNNKKLLLLIPLILALIIGISVTFAIIANKGNGVPLLADNTVDAITPTPTNSAEVLPEKSSDISEDSSDSIQETTDAPIVLTGDSVQTPKADVTDQSTPTTGQTKPIPTEKPTTASTAKPVATSAISTNVPTTTEKPTAVPQYVLTFDANGGRVSEPSRLVSYKTEYGQLPIPTRDYYSFFGWFTAANGGVEVNSMTRMGTSKVTVYAHWELKPFSGVWSEWSFDFIQEDDYTMVKKRTVYCYPIYAMSVYGKYYEKFNSGVLLTLRQNGASDTVIDRVKSIMMNQDPFGLDVSYEDDPIRYMIENVDQLQHLDSNLCMLQDITIVETPYPSDMHGKSIEYNGYEWLLNVNDGSTRVQYRYQKRLK